MKNILNRLIQYKYFSTFNKIYNFTKNDLNKNVLLSYEQYEGKRGVVSNRAELYRLDLKEGRKLPFSEVIILNKQSPQKLGQLPIKFNRQVISGLLYPELLQTNQLSEDVKSRVKFYMEQIGLNSGIGAYSDPRGFKFVRNSVLDFISKRDKLVENSTNENILLSNGIYESLELLLQNFIKYYRTGVMIPTPGIHYYSALISQCGGSECQYRIQQSNLWEVKRLELDQAYHEAVTNGINPKIIIVTNPGDPTGQVYSKRTIQKIIEFANDNQLLIIVDESYQQNVNEDKQPFVSFKQARSEMHPRFWTTPLISLNSASYGFMGEKGSKSGYIEFSSIPFNIVDQIANIQSIHVCPNTIGQIYIDLMCNPPTQNNVSAETYENYAKEIEEIKKTQKKNTEVMYEYLNEMENITVTQAASNMYAYPQIQFSQKIIDALKQQNQLPCLFYTLRLLEETGVAVVPGSAFNQDEGYHFRLSCSLNRSQLENALQKIKQFNTEFHKGDWINEAY